MKKILAPIFFGNYFVAFCLVLMTIDTSICLGYTLLNPIFYLLLFIGTQIYYTSAYFDQTSSSNINRRSSWYLKNKKVILFCQYLFGASLILLLIFTLLNYSDQLANIEFWQYFLVIFPVILAILYYGLPTGGTQKYSLRNSGWLKPFVIAYVWTSTTCLYPVLLRQLEIDAFHFTITNQLAFHCFRQFIFISITAILFDIKDYKDDFNRELKTLVVRLGVNRTVSFVIIPFIIAGVALDLYYTDSYQSHFWTSIICIIPYLVMLWLSINLLQHKSIFYYLVMIDGLLLLKAVVDVTGFMIYKRMI